MNTRSIVLLLATLASCGGDGISSHPTQDMALPPDLSRSSACDWMPQSAMPRTPTPALAFSHGDENKFAAGSNVLALVLADVNNDYHLDVIAADNGVGSTGGGLVVLLGNGDGTLAAAHTFSAGDAPSAIAAADVDADGNVDLIVTNNGLGGNGLGGSTQIDVLLGKGNGTFAAPVPYTVGGRTRGVVARDLNGDCRIDVAVANLETNSVAVLIGNGDGTFGTANAIPVGQWPWWLVATDLNRDGVVDLLAADFQDGDLSVLTGRGDGTFTTSAVGIGAPQSFVAVADLDGDGSPESITTAANYVDRFTVLANDGHGLLQNPTGIATTSVPWAISAADLDADGRVDLVVAESNAGKTPNVVDVFLNGANGLQSPIAIPTSDQSQAVELGDVNGDGLPDIVVAGLTSVSVFLNSSH